MGEFFSKAALSFLEKGTRFEDAPSEQAQRTR